MRELFVLLTLLLIGCVTSAAQTRPAPLTSITQILDAVPDKEWPQLVFTQPDENLKSYIEYEQGADERRSLNDFVPRPSDDRSKLTSEQQKAYDSYKPMWDYRKKLSATNDSRIRDGLKPLEDLPGGPPSIVPATQPAAQPPPVFVWTKDRAIAAAQAINDQDPRLAVLSLPPSVPHSIGGWSGDTMRFGGEVDRLFVYKSFFFRTVTIDATFPITEAAKVVKIPGDQPLWFVGTLGKVSFVQQDAKGRIFGPPQNELRLSFSDCRVMIPDPH